jgi:hypothetical protein
VVWTCPGARSWAVAGTTPPGDYKVVLLTCMLQSNDDSIPVIIRLFCWLVCFSRMMTVLKLCYFLWFLMPMFLCIG